MRHPSDALRIVALYVIFAALWILFSDRLLDLLTAEATVLSRLQTIKGWLFVAITGLLLYHLIAHSFRQLMISQQALRKSNDRFRATFEQAAVGMAHVGLDGSWLQVNERMCDILGYSADELREINFQTVTFPEDLNTDLEQAQLLLAGAINTYSLEKRYIRRDGRVVWAYLTVTLHRGDDGTPQYFISVVQDIDARKAVEQQAQEMRAALDASFSQLVQALARSVETRDPYTAGHHNHTALLATAIAAHMGLDEERIEGIRVAAQIHDLGNIYIPAEILNRAGRLTEAEMALVRTHPRVGADILDGIPFPWPLQAIILQHQERLDGSGYPQGLRGEQISLEARIVAVAEVAEAMTSHRPYRPAHTVEETIAELQSGRGIRFDAAVVDTCIELVRKNGLPWLRP